MTANDVWKAGRLLLRQLKSSTLPVFCFALALLGVIWAATWLQLRSDRAAQQRDYIQETANLAVVFEQNVARTIGEIDRLMVYLRESYQRYEAVQAWPELIAGRHANSSCQLSRNIGGK
jgi:hypothetical protein